MFFVTLLYSGGILDAHPIRNSLPCEPSCTLTRSTATCPPQRTRPPSSPCCACSSRRAGVGQVLVTQNPVDVDYKGLSNAGSWFIGKLQTDQDKQRLLDGLSSAAVLTAGG